MASAGLVALDIGGTSIKGLAVPAPGAAAIASRRVPAPDGPEAALAAVFGTLRELAAAGPVRGIGIASTGLIDERTGIVRFSSAFGWRELGLAELVRAEFGVPVAVVQDMNAAALAERRANPEVHDTFTYVGLGTGIGTTTMLNGTPWSGSTGIAGELGHIRMPASAHRCRCGGIGCLDTVASGWGIGRRYFERAGHDLEVEEIVARRHSDPTAAAVWQEGCAALGAALATFALIMDPGLILIGGGLSLAGAALLAPVRDAFAAASPLPSESRLQLSALGDRATLAGAVLAIEQLCS